jgi:ectoine hydroxylase-related dioxygenase (phytanoyl-CoA dioxygenase family)
MSEMAEKSPQSGDTFRTIDDLYADHAGTHRSTAGKHEKIDAKITAADVQAVKKDGFVIMENLLNQEQLSKIKEEADRLLSHYGRNSFEGQKTRRIYAVLAKTDAGTPLLEHPRVLCALDELLMDNYLLSMFQMINVEPGESQQMLHHDDAFYPIARPRRAFSYATILAVDDFTAENGATVYVPGSHRWDDRRPNEAEIENAVPIVMKAGSAVLFSGTLWHGGGANKTDKSRLAVTCQYCEPWARTQENMILAVPREVAARQSDNIKRMLGYSIHPPFVGQVNGMSPLRTLGEI